MKTDTPTPDYPGDGIAIEADVRATLRVQLQPGLAPYRHNGRYVSLAAFTLSLRSGHPVGFSRFLAYTQRHAPGGDIWSRRTTALTDCHVDDPATFWQQLPEDVQRAIGDSIDWLDRDIPDPQRELANAAS